MPHICTRCGKEYPDASKEVLLGCVCGNTTFLYQRNLSSKGQDSTIPLYHADHDEKGPDSIPKKETEPASSLESIRIIRPGEYDINLIQMAQSQDRVIKIGRDGEYRLNLHSMIGKKKK